MPPTTLGTVFVVWSIAARVDALGREGEVEVDAARSGPEPRSRIGSSSSRVVPG